MLFGLRTSLLFIIVRFPADIVMFSATVILQALWVFSEHQTCKATPWQFIVLMRNQWCFRALSRRLTPINHHWIHQPPSICSGSAWLPSGCSNLLVQLQKCVNHLQRIDFFHKVTVDVFLFFLSAAKLSRTLW